MGSSAQAELKEAATLAGFKELTFVPEPVASVIAYKFDEDFKNDVKKVD